ncbi:MAG: type II toxin-antitoxin system death-on-curing family toxin [Xanthomonadaceae bacterium]|nr:type II toxin-antitoxin system death-on-curing family toxin [Xanthomonadaceae bacterium]
MEFLDKDVVLAIHDRQLAEHGGLAGVRDDGLLDSALARPQNRHAYGIENIEELASAYAHGIARNLPFLEGNKRTAWAVARTFMAMNGQRPVPDRVQAVENMVLLAEGLLDEAGFAAWLGSQPRR